MKTVGSRAEVFHGTAKHTSGGLEKKDLLQNKHGRIVSRRKHNTAKKGKFGAVRLDGKNMKSSRKSRRSKKSRR